MAAATSIALDDGQSTPVSHTFVPARKNGVIVYWEERTTAHTPLGFYIMSMGQGPASSTSPVQRGKFSLLVPIETYDSVTGAYSYEKVMRANVECIIPTTASAADRENLSAFLRNGVAETTFRSMVEGSNPPY
jgi:hypothetical protein